MPRLSRGLWVACVALLGCDANPDCIGPYCAAPPCEDDAGDYLAPLTALNGSRIEGEAQVITGALGTTLWVDLVGAAPGLHPQQLRGFASEVARCPDAGDDTDGDGWIDAEEAEAAHGPVLEQLTPFPEADETGQIAWEEHWHAEGLCPLETRVVLVQGTFVDGVYDERMPAACGEIRLMRTFHR